MQGRTNRVLGSVCVSVVLACLIVVLCQGQDAPPTAFGDQYRLKIQEADPALGTISTATQTVTGKIIQVSPGMISFNYGESPAMTGTIQFEFVTVREKDGAAPITVVYPYLASFVVGEQASITYAPFASRFIQADVFLKTFFPDRHYKAEPVVSIWAAGVIVRDGLVYR